MKKTSQSGFTLVELITTMAIVAVLLTIGIPSIQTMMRNNRVAVHANEFISALNFARSEAVKLGGDSLVILCPGTSSGCSGSDWGNGWIVFVDTDKSGNWSSDDMILRVYDALGGNDNLVADSNIGSYIAFAADGSARRAGGAFIDNDVLTFSLCNSSNQRNTIVINSVGRARVVPVSCS